MTINLETAATRCLDSKKASLRTRRAYAVTLKKWKLWGTADDVSLSLLTRKTISEFLDWVHAYAIAEDGTNPGRTTNKARENLRAILSWAWQQDLVETLPRFPESRPQRDVAGRHYLSKAEIDALYFATYAMDQPRGWNDHFAVGRYWRAALVLRHG